MNFREFTRNNWAWLLACVACLITGFTLGSCTTQLFEMPVSFQAEKIEQTPEQTPLPEGTPIPWATPTGATTNQSVQSCISQFGWVGVQLPDSQEIQMTVAVRTSDGLWHVYIRYAGIWASAGTLDPIGLTGIGGTSYRTRYANETEEIAGAIVGNVANNIVTFSLTEYAPDATITVDFTCVA